MADQENSAYGWMWWTMLCGASIAFWIFSWAVGNPVAYFVCAMAFFVLVVPAVYFDLAPRNYFFTFVQEGTVKIIVKGGQVSNILINTAGYTLNRSWDIVQGWEFHLFGGLRFYGIWPIYDVYVYEFSWTSVAESGELRKHVKELLDYALTRFAVYYAIVEDIVDSDLLPLKVELLLTIRIVNPYRALFAVQDWLKVVVNRLAPVVRGVVNNVSYERLVTAPDTSATEEVQKAVQTAAQGLCQTFAGEYGVEVVAIEVRDIIPANKDILDIALKKTVAKREADAAVEVAKGRAKAIRIENNAVQKYGDLGKYLQLLDALKTSPGQGSKWILPIPGLLEEIANAIGQRRRPRGRRRQQGQGNGP